jgi:dihydrolipoamide dehydrogenase
MNTKYDIAVIGAGPGGYVAALRASQSKKRVVVLEKENVGGTCMNWGCIPTKYLLHQTKIYKQVMANDNIDGAKTGLRCNWTRLQDEKSQVVERLVKGIEFLLKQNGVDVIKGEARLRSEKEIRVFGEGENQTLEADKIILATGSLSTDLPFLNLDGSEVIDSQKALELESVPRSMLIIGAGAIGLEMGTIFHRLGCGVKVLELLPTILPGSDRAMTKRLERILKLQGLDIQTQMRIEEAEVRTGIVNLRGTCAKNDKPFEYEAEKVLLATGRRPNSFQFRDGDVPISLDEAGFVRVNDHLETDVPGIYAIGDLIGGKLLAHKASHEGLVAAVNAAGGDQKMSYDALPMSVFTEPEFASVGLTEKELKDTGAEAKVGQFSLQANGRALTLGELEGVVKVVANKNGRLVGAQIIAPNASELVAELTLGVAKGLTLQDVSHTIHIHPTLSEAVMESALHALGEAIHVLNT